MSDETGEQDRSVVALRSVASVFALVGEYAADNVANGVTFDDLVISTATEAEDVPLGVMTAALLYLANLVNLGPDDLMRMGYEIADKLPNEGTNTNGNPTERN